MKKIIPILCVISLYLSVQGCNISNQSQVLVSDIQAFNQAVAKAVPGMTIIMKNGVWKDVELLFEGDGTLEKSIVLKAETRGGVTIEGQSNLRISGSYLVVDGLVFKNGFTLTSEVISFKKDKNTLANNCRLTACVIDDFTNPERHDADTWVAIYGKNNRVDHNHLSGKGNRGVTMIVKLNTKESQENKHRIDHNYFGPRENLGSNGGETLRIGTSHFSLTNSKTLVENNYFDRCDGEHEIISNKSGQNTYRNNLFYECRGTLTMRHGKETLIDSNIFIGNGKPNIGGIRVINGQQTVINNYAVGLTGYRFRGAFVIMNGIYNSPINRYHQVKDAVVKNNTFLNCDHIQLCAGSDKERNAPPENSLVEGNIFYNENKDDRFTIYDDITGIKFVNNIASPNTKLFSKDGFKKKKLNFKPNKNGLLMPEDTTVGATLKDTIPTKENTGVSWYKKGKNVISFDSGKTIKVNSGLNTLYNAIINSSPGDVIELTSSDEYTITKIIKITHPITVVNHSDKKPTIFYEKKSLFEIDNGGSISLKGLRFNGSQSPDRPNNSVVSTSNYSMTKNYNVIIDDCEFEKLDINHSFDVLRVSKNTFADTISIKNSSFKSISGNVLALNKEIDNIGIYNAEYVFMINNTFSDIGGVVLDLYRGGTDESTFGPFLTIDHCVFDNVGKNKKNQAKSAITLYGVQDLHIQNSIFRNSKALKAHLVVGEPIVNFLNLNFDNSEGITVKGDEKYTMNNIWKLPSGFSENTYKLSNISALKAKGTDKLDLGLIVK